MSTVPQVASNRAPPGAAAALGRAAPPALSRRRAVRAADEWLSRAGWTVSRTGRPGLVGLALLFAAALFLLSTHLKVVAEVEALRSDVAAARRRPRAAEEVSAPSPATRALPARTDIPAVLRQLFEKAAEAQLAVDTAKYEIDATRSSGVVRYRLAFPVTGPYPQVRAFLDETLATMPAVALQDLALERKSIGDGTVEAQIRMTVYTRSAP